MQRIQSDSGMTKGCVVPPTGQWQKQDWIMLLIVAAVSGLVFLCGLNGYGILDPSDGLYTECTREMLELNHYVTPTFNYEPFYEKPILIYWSILGAYKMFGVAAWAARLPSALCAAFTATGLFCLARMFLRRRAALLSSLVLMSAPLFVVVGHLALTDMLLTVFLTMSMLCFLLKLSGGRDWSLWTGYATLGLAVLAKGPLAVLLLGAVLVLYLLLNYGGEHGGENHGRWYQYWWQQLVRLKPVPGLAIVLLIAGPWYITECLKTKGEFFQEFFIRQNIGRATGTVNHQNPWWFYLPYLLGGFFPWCIFLLADGKNFVRQWKQRKLATCRNRLGLFCLCWVVVVLVLFTSVRTKLGTYILPAFPPLAILAGMSFDRSMRVRALPALGRITGVLLVGAAAVLCFLPKLKPVFGQPSPMHATLLVLAWALVLLGFGIATFLIHTGKTKAALYQLLGSSLVGTAILVPVGLHLYDEIKDQPYRNLLAESQAAHANLATYMRDSPAASFYLRRKVPLVMYDKDYAEFLASAQKPRWFLVSQDVLARLLARPEPKKLIDHQGKFYLYEME